LPEIGSAGIADGLFQDLEVVSVIKKTAINYERTSNMTFSILADIFTIVAALIIFHTALPVYKTVPACISYIVFMAVMVGICTYCLIVDLRAGRRRNEKRHGTKFTARNKR
jgi:hypothetical protein